MAYGRARKRTSSRRRVTRHSGYSRGRRTVSRRTTSRRGSGTLRIVIEQPGASVARPEMAGLMTQTMRKAKF